MTSYLMEQSHGSKAKRLVRRDFKELFKDQHLPLAFVDLDLIDINAQDLLRRAQGIPIRIASKSVRCLDVIRHVLDNHKGFQGILGYSAGEAAYLAENGFDDIVVAYPTVDRQDIHSIIPHLKRGFYICLMVDHADQVRMISEIASEQGITIPVAFDIDLSSKFPFLHFGVQRSPLRTVADVQSLHQVVKSLPGIRLDGVMGYEAQIAGLPDAVPSKKLKSAVIRILKKISMKQVIQKRVGAVQALQDEGAQLKFVNAGGTGSLEISALDPSITELTAGSGLYGPALFDGFHNFHPQPAAGFAVPITRIPEPGIFTCHGGGYIASGPVGPDKAPQIFSPERAELLELEGVGEVQTPVQSKEELAIGDPVIFRHAKAGELCERFNAVKIISKGRLAGEAKTYRGDGQCFL